LKAKKKLGKTSKEEYVLPARAPFTYVVTSLGVSLVAIVRMTSLQKRRQPNVVWSHDNEWEEVNAKLVSSNEEVDQVTLWSGRQLQPPKPARKGKEKEATPILTSVAATERRGEDPLPSSSNNKGATKDKKLAEEPRRDLPISVPFQVRQGSHKERVRYDVISHLKRIPARLSAYDGLQMSKELRRARIQALMDPDDYKYQVGPINVNEVLSLPPNRCAVCMACITFTDEDMQLGSTDHNRPLYVTNMIGDKKINRILLDCGSAVNLLPLRVLQAIGITPNQLSPTLPTIQGFN